MTDLLAARSQMAISLGFHIIFACIGMTLPFFMVISHFYWLKTKETVYLTLTKAWASGVAILFATGAVSGTVLSFELGLLWPEFMLHAGPIIGMPFSLEGACFFIEAIALGLFLYGWKKLHPWVHWASGVVIGISGVLSGIFVTGVNAWMNNPTGFDWINGKAENIDPIAVLLNPLWYVQSLHMVLAAFVATGIAVAGVHAYFLLKYPHMKVHRVAMIIAMSFASITAILQPISGDLCAKYVAKTQPVKFAALEAHYHTEAGAPIILGGIPDSDNETVHYGLKIPNVLSFLAYSDFSAEVKGLTEFPKEDWPNIPIVHWSFQVMVGIGLFLAGLGILFLTSLCRKRRLIKSPLFLKTLVVSIPLGFIAVETGWMVTEVGRQPWIIQGIMRTKDAVTPMPGLVYPFLLFTGVYILLSLMVTWLMLRQFKALHVKELSS